MYNINYSRKILIGILEELVNQSQASEHEVQSSNSINKIKNISDVSHEIGREYSAKLSRTTVKGIDFLSVDFQRFHRCEQTNATEKSY